MTRETAVLAALESIEEELTGPDFAEIRHSPFGIGLAMFMSGARRHPAQFYDQVVGVSEIITRFIDAVDKMEQG